MIFINSNPIRLIELFAGIGSQAKAMANLGLDFEHWRICEFDENAIRSYNAVHGTDFVTSDITEINAGDLGITETDKFTYLLTYSFPCQDLSSQGKGAGMKKGSGTRSGLLWEVERLLDECTELPQVLLMENVPQVHGEKNMEHFNEWITFLESKGYSNYWQDLNSKDYGVPQNRNRCYMVSILGDYSFEFPGPVVLEKTLGDILDENVGKQYYITEGGRGTMLQRTVCDKAIKITKPYEMIDYTYSNARLKELESDGKLTVRNRSDALISCTLTTRLDNFAVRMPNDKFRVLSTLEGWRLMGFDDNDYHRASAVCCDKELRKQAGNSIVVNVLMAIFKKLFVPGTDPEMEDWML